MLAQLQISQTIGTGPGCSYWLSWAIIVPCLFEDCLLVVVVAVVVFFLMGACPFQKRHTTGVRVGLLMGQPFVESDGLPSGKHTKNYGKITILNGKIHYFYGHFQ